jgi:actin
MADDNSVSLIFDNGSYQSRSGFATDEYPRIIYPSIYGYPRSEIEPNHALNYYGKNAMQHSSSLTLKEIFPGTREPISWDIYESFLHTIIADEFQSESLDRPVLTNFYFNSGKEIRERQCQIFFENFGASSYFSVSNGLLGLYSSGRLNGIVLDAGHRQTSITPIIDGSPLTYAQDQIAFGGRNLTDFIQTKCNLSREISRQLKEANCTAATDYDKDTGEYRIIKEEETKENEIKLPDGTIVGGVKDACAIASESPFRPSVIGSSAVGAQELLFSALLKTDFDLRRELASNIIFTGGNSCMTNFTERMQKELSILVPSLLKVKILNYPDKEMASWYGGAIISSVGTFQTMWITKSEYEETGPSIIFRKCL